jgi:hypothetical protein
MPRAWKPHGRWVCWVQRIRAGAVDDLGARKQCGTSRKGHHLRYAENGRLGIGVRGGRKLTIDAVQRMRGGSRGKEDSTSTSADERRAEQRRSERTQEERRRRLCGGGGREGGNAGVKQGERRRWIRMDGGMEGSAQQASSEEERAARLRLRRSRDARDDEDDAAEGARSQALQREGGPGLGNSHLPLPSIHSR